ncbi:hypothetical protein ACMD2_10702 [Ananas comosus]|uniref:ROTUNDIFOLIA like 8 n=1 Tax=Ananas comosus TaxID=4615 RepID=A0A199VBQ2_ANACO|nr:hypothetical protein ACMD2_10702 [Ananas comosus]
MEMYMDERWKLSKTKGSRNGSRRSVMEDGHGSGHGPFFLRSSGSTRESTNTKLRRSCSTSAATKPRVSTTFSRRCASLIKEQRARFYIMRRCVTMLLCWRDYP